MEPPTDALGRTLVAYSRFEQSLRILYVSITLADIFHRTRTVPENLVFDHLSTAIDLIETGRLVFAIEGNLRALDESFPHREATVDAWRKSLRRRCHNAMQDRNSLVHADFDYAALHRDPAMLRTISRNVPTELSAQELVSMADKFGSLADDIVRFGLGLGRSRPRGKRSGSQDPG